MAAARPGRAGDPFADRMDVIGKYVVSDTLEAADLTRANTTLVPGTGAVDRARRRRATGGRDLLVTGSPTPVRSLLAEDLVDEPRLMVMPVLPGGGKTLFPTDGVRRMLDLVSTEVGRTAVHVTSHRRTDT
ncbi:dihydrofolate reductase family protein [Kitasatospora sp. NPDC059599]|uniref:dihydrofolate reductase family protein n=1 Tax=Kitasatospora sp. NPDC059599 TaxID=3346880 RepID=UPI0036767A13